jgi:ribulose-phosphate 3-epimerase
MNTPPRIIASVLGADYTQLGHEVTELARAGVDGIQWDIMDGAFVPAITFGAEIVEACRPLVDIPFEAHLMVQRPKHHIESFLEAGCDTIIVHAEAAADLGSLIAAIHELGGRAGVALNPETPLNRIQAHLDHIDQLLIMTVNPGAAGQPFLEHTEAKIAEARQLVANIGRNTHIEVDGGITPTTITRALQAGADTFVSGSWILNSPVKANAVRDLARAVQSAARDESTRQIQARVGEQLTPNRMHEQSLF